ncbi:tabersonine 16-O-methyltransferase-like [Coffea eugenioides]|uniref:tabersonine 16-O-methyltransferase-like n=1 Tax=Coffea eugenioides TaxID=49369 RepID=UPI000F614C9C|nr:tabersonine 16-O-methyltransferase-like [Coffea eugenioides]
MSCDGHVRARGVTGFFVENPQGYALTSAGQLLLKDEAFNVRAHIFLSCDPALLKRWNLLTEWFQNDGPSPFDTAYGNNLWDYSAREVRFGNMFNEAMASDSQSSVEVLMTKCKFVFEGLTTFADVGGGTGKVAQNFPSIKCTVYDLAHVVANQEGAENLEFLAGDMFHSVPRANAILLKMLVNFGPAKERTEKEWSKLFSEAGFSSYKVYPVLGMRCLIEVYP